MVLITIFSLAGCQLGKTEPEKENPQTSDNTTHEVETEEKDENVSIKELKDFDFTILNIRLSIIVNPMLILRLNYISSIFH